MTLRSCSTSYRTYYKIMIYCFGACSKCDATCRRLWMLNNIWLRNHECLDQSQYKNWKVCQLLVPNVSYILNHENNTFHSSGQGKRERKKKKGRKKNFSKESLQNAVNIMEYYCNFLQQQKLSVQQHYYQSLTINSKEQIQAVIDGLYFFVCCHQ